jgi:hypothetical protein
MFAECGSRSTTGSPAKVAAAVSAWWWPRRRASPAGGSSGASRTGPDASSLPIYVSGVTSRCLAELQCGKSGSMIFAGPSTRRAELSTAGCPMTSTSTWAGDALSKSAEV